MKKLILTISAISSLVFGAMAQPDFGFETWADAAPPYATIDDPQGWASLNALVGAGTDTSAFKITVGPAAGTASAKIKTVKIVGAAIPNPYASGNLDTAGFLVIGKVSILPPGLIYGYSYTTRSAQLSFQSKYTPMTGDSAFVLAYLTKWNGTSRDTIATGKYATGASTTSYSLTNLSMDYNPVFAGIVPDSERIMISSSVYSHDGAKIGSTFYIDDLAWSGYNSTNEINGIVNSVTVFPNPATNYISISSSIDVSTIEINDITGRLIGSYSMKNNNRATIQTTDFSPGIYIYSIFDQQKEVINRGKFEIVK